MTTAPATDKRAIKEGAAVLRALHATCPTPGRLPPESVLRHVALHLRLDLPTVLASRDARRIEATGLKRDYAAALFRAFQDDAGAADRLRAGAAALLLGLPPRHLRGALGLWDTEAAERLRRDPFGALFDLKGTLEEAQACAPADMPLSDRMVHHARWLLRGAARDGHTLMSRITVASKLMVKHALPASDVLEVLRAAVEAGQLAAVGTDGLADPQQCSAELAIARDVVRRAREPPIVDYETLALGAEQALTDEQRQALRTVLSARIAVLTGGPGTGKSHVVKALVEVVGEDACLLTAPTGRAARHVGGSTVHSASGGRLLRRPLQETKPEDLQPGLRVTVVDEASMLSTELMTGVLNLVPRDCLVLLVGDADQLPPVGAGNVLRDLLDSGTVPVGRLTYNHRSVTEVQRIARAVLEGRVPEEPLDWQLATSVAQGMAGVVRAAGADPECGVLTPHNAGRHLLNRALQSCVRDVPVQVRDTASTMRPRGLLRTDPATGRSIVRLPDGTLPSDRMDVGVDTALALTASMQPLQPGDAVMVLKNQNKKRRRPGEVSACNGDVGELVRLSPKPIVRFSDGISEFPAADPWLTLAYAATVHKFQGSECDRVVLPIYSAIMWDRQLLYTAITRARHKVTFVGCRADLAAIVARTRPSRRSALAALLSQLTST